MARTSLGNAPTFLDEAHDPEQLAFDLGRITAFSKPVLLTTGGHSPPLFAPLVARIAAALPAAQLHAFPDAGHIPHVTHPDSYIAAIADFIGTNPT